MTVGFDRKNPFHNDHFVLVKIYQRDQSLKSFGKSSAAKFIFKSLIFQRRDIATHVAKTVLLDYVTTLICETTTVWLLS